MKTIRLTGSCFLLVMLACSKVGFAFSLLGPFPAWQTDDYSGFNIGYDQPGDIGGPKALSEGYRWNVPVITYAYDRTFLNYFGTNGIAALEEAIRLINEIPPTTAITNDRSHLYINGERVPTDTKRKNFLAENLGLLDLKSTAMTAILEELGLTSAERHAWSLRGRNDVDDIITYSTIQLNFDPITLLPSSMVNGVLYSYEIVEFANPNTADAIEIPVDPFAFAFSSVASAFSSGGLIAQGIDRGEFFTGLTQDDVAGLRWLYNTNNLVNESLLTTVAAGTPIAGTVGGSPWRPFLEISNLFLLNTNSIFATNNIGTNATNIIVQGLRPGINKVRLERVSYDSLVGQTFVTLTNRYTDTTISNGIAVIQPLQRVLNQPDIVFAAEDLGLVDNVFPVLFARTGTDGWINNDAINGQDAEVDGGPGMITPPAIISFSDLLPYWLNSTPSVLNEVNAFRSAIWGSFDGTTNTPIVYPNHGNFTIDVIRARLNL